MNNWAQYFFFFLSKFVMFESVVISVKEEIKHVLRAFIAWWKPEANFPENWRADQWKSETQLRVLTCSKILTNFAEFFTRLWKHREHVLFFSKIIFGLNKEKGDIWSVYVYFNFFHEIVNSHNLETANNIAHVVFVLYISIKTHMLTNQTAPTIQIIL